jgi:hypothetical protein
MTAEIVTAKKDRDAVEMELGKRLMSSHIE